MAYIQNGVYEKSKMFFYSSAQKDGPFFYPISAGHFYCNSDYMVKRDSFDSILITIIIRGSFSFLIDGKEHTAKSGDVALLDCFKEHTYYTNDNFEAYWIHINGSNTYEIFKELTGRFSNIISADEKTEEQIKDIYTAIKNARQLSDSQMSLKIYTLLTELFNRQAEEKQGGIIETALDYISSNYSKSITVEDVAKNVHLSASQFSRKFKKETGTSPYDYILGTRLTRAKELLKNTSLSVSEIAYRTGFSSDSNFIYFFRKQEGISPLKFRNILF